MAGVQLFGWDATNKVWVPVAVDASGNLQMVSTPVAETPVGIVNRYSGADTSYQVLCTWTVSALKTGQLVEVSMVVDVFASALWKLDIGTVSVMLDDAIQTALTLPFANLSLAEGTVITLSVKSTGAAIVADGSITGKEIG